MKVVVVLLLMRASWPAPNTTMHARPARGVQQSVQLCHLMMYM
jgi:hypothetical protein